MKKVGARVVFAPLCALVRFDVLISHAFGLLWCFVRRVVQCGSTAACVAGSGFAARPCRPSHLGVTRRSAVFSPCALHCAPVAYEMALEQIIADLDDLEERVENLNVDQKTNEDILLNVLKRVDETEKDLRKV